LKVRRPSDGCQAVNKKQSLTPRRSLTPRSRWTPRSHWLTLMGRSPLVQIMRCVFVGGGSVRRFSAIGRGAEFKSIEGRSPLQRAKQIRGRHAAEQEQLGLGLLDSGPGGPGGLLPQGSRRSVRALSGIRLVTSWARFRDPLLFRGHIHGFRCTRRVSLQRGHDVVAGEAPVKDSCRAG
jgi:hypothetical protein